ncbi:hypothetical protein PCCS19_36330 [Paenibacillus sp. CCS19]|uniref:dynamin family protein n=1 Tax=Paenibacillus sp. CCS19 TaxID=3158387 RepID=UPI00256BED34|nr:dynamin family protein [Paenibacillus cellulosilyticus]GMK40577.1 hypothetical protein PCCS19_36330 [Paenibacillus cellulosilyticus]
MIGYEAGKAELLNTVMRIHSLLDEQLSDSIFMKDLMELGASIREDRCTIVVLGEFKRGKSTFINSLLGEDLLPVDVTPTTATINAMIYGEQRSLMIKLKDGTVEQRPLTKANIDAYSAEGTENPDEVRYLQLSLPSEMLASRVIVVDTPGVNDLNQQRAEVTYQFVPRADAVIFLLDATSPVKRSEKQFLTDTLLEEGLERMLFIANFYDQLDEEVDPDAHLDHIRNRLTTVMGGKKQQVLPYSATAALEARLSNDRGALEASGYPNVMEAVQQLIEHGTQGEARLDRYRFRMRTITNSIIRELDGRIALLDESEDEISRKLKSVEDLMKRHGAIQREMDDYTHDRETEMLAITRKSLHYFEEQLKEDMQYMMMQLTGPQLKDFVEVQLPIQVKRRLKQWIEQYTPSMVKMLQMLEQELATALATEFNTALLPLLDKGKLETLHTADNNFHITGADLSNTPIMAGLIAGGAGMLAMLLGGPLLLPLVGMAGFPFIQKYMMQEQLKKAREKLQPELDAVLDQVVDAFSVQVESWLLNNAGLIRKAAEARYVDIVRANKLRLESEIGRMKHSINDKVQEKLRLRTAQEEISQWQYSLQ